jgi:hypothetical protein
MVVERSSAPTRPQIGEWMHPGKRPGGKLLAGCGAAGCDGGVIVTRPPDPTTIRPGGDA